jgi:hypothetical protein
MSSQFSKQSEYWLLLHGESPNGSRILLAGLRSTLNSSAAKDKVARRRGTRVTSSVFVPSAAEVRPPPSFDSAGLADAQSK